MNHKTSIGILIGLVAVLAVGGFMLFGQPDKGPRYNSQLPAPAGEQQVQAITFYGVSGEEVPATFAPHSVTFSTKALGEMTLSQTPSGSGARYADANEKIVFWNKGNEITIYKDNAIIFQGSTVRVSGKLPAGSKAPGTAEELRASTWVWTKTVNADGSVVTPKKPGVFTLTFGSDARVTGKTDCNGFGGTYELGSDGIISFGPFMSTQMFCEGSQETEYSNAVYTSHHYTVSGTELILKNDTNGGSTYFKKQ